ncbi:MAG: chromosome segregation protein SMC [Pseudomonadota bacterium]|nr:chromosome segregation protein SMC [Gammaproteobacteria bacterium]MBU1926287.1 chromosome segregation protein SMC [Gammaproteobacteria bacterium]MBU2545882.1 chromosome segregation protein SMC [Gammaproteobacteria bacterium]
MSLSLDAIKLMGFKSFVDPTIIKFPSIRTGVVGPNGCGKSNILDAIRWVMGESSAKQLRGESIIDVIFNGSRDRQPIGQASVELIFNNEDHSLGGAYAKYNQISVKRIVDREAQSTYFLNNVRCRRRDITDVFLGTGLGARSYSMIGQGTITSLVESKPEELREHLEEVAGITLYKERRKETESRIKSTRENLNRVNDLREELGKQLDRLQRQARAALRYKVLKEDERLLKAQLLTLKWLEIKKELENHQIMLSKEETLLASYQADFQRVETEIEKKQLLKTELGDQFNQVQEKYYQLGSEITRLEQSIEHKKARGGELTEELSQTEQNLQKAIEELSRDETNVQTLQKALEELKPLSDTTMQRAEQSRLDLTEAEQYLQNWQNDWDTFNTRAAEIAQIAQVEQARIQHLEEQKQFAAQQLEKIQKETQSAEEMQELVKKLEHLQSELELKRHILSEDEAKLSEILSKIEEQKKQNQSLESELSETRQKLQATMGRFASLDALQQAALGKKKGDEIQWLSHHQLANHSRLAQELKVVHGWERAVEVVLGTYLEAVCVDELDPISKQLDSFSKGNLSFIERGAVHPALGAQPRPLLKEKIESPWSLGSLLDGVYVANNLQEALSHRHELAPNESFITQEGIWVGAHWLRVMKEADEQAGVIHRETELRQIQDELAKLKDRVATLEQALSKSASQLNEFEKMRDASQRAIAQSHSVVSDYKARIQIHETQLNQIQARKIVLEKDAASQQMRIETSISHLADSKKQWSDALKEMEEHADVRENLLLRRNEFREVLEKTRRQAESDKEEAHQLELKILSKQSELQALEQTITRARVYVQQLEIQKQKFTDELTHVNEPLNELNSKLQSALEKRVQIDDALNQAKQQIDRVEQEMQAFLNQRRTAETNIQSTRETLEAKRLRQQELMTRQSTVQEQIKETDFVLDTLIENLPEEANGSDWMERLERVGVRINRLGPINLAAITEFEELSERKVYLDAQFTDLEDALNTLIEAIRKIDKETKQCFKETFDKVNEFFKSYFPKVFGGGTAYLELIGEDLLDAGVALMAKPPGKKVGNIHQLSGGEKTLTAIALVFSLFQLNPAPFCVLDEVDAPLDDTNVGHFCNLVKEMSEKVQFIFVSHNKETIEMATHLVGITMQEPGVSRVVSVDIDSAIGMVGTS